MEKMMNLAAIVAIAAQISSVAGAAVLPANGLRVLTEMAAGEDWVIDGVVCEAWASPASEWSVRALARMLDLAGPGLGTFAPTEATTVKVLAEADQLVVQVTSTSLAEGETYYQKLTQWMRLFGQGRPVGATILARVPAGRSAESCQALLAQAAGEMPMRLVSAMGEGRLASCAYYVPGIHPSLTVAGEKINLNMACVCEESLTRIYLGTPVIYQQY